MPDPISWLLIGICLLLSFFFSASETALACCNRFKLQIQADNGSRSAKLILKVKDKYDRALTVVLIGNDVVCVAMSAISTLLFVNYFEGTGMSDYASIISSIIITIIVYIFGDTFPKVIAQAIPDTFSKISIYPIYGLMIILWPLTSIFSGLTYLFDKLFKHKQDDDFTEEDFENIVEKVSEEGLLEDEQSDIMQSALDFADTKVKEVFTPLEKMYSIDLKNTDNDQLQNIVMNTKYSRIPVYYESYDSLKGVLVVKKYLAEYTKNPNVDINKLLTKPYYVSQNINLDDLFNGFKKHKTHLAFVVNSEHKVIGMVTMEDVLEELVSDISEPSRVKGDKK